MAGGARWARKPGVAAALFLSVAGVAWPFLVDDAFITVRYAVRLASGLGYTFRNGPPTDGVTGPLWLLPLWSVARMGGDAVLAAKLCGLLACAVSVARVVQRLAGQTLGRTAAPLAALFCVTSIPLTIWSIGGLETGLATLCATELALAVPARVRSTWASAGLARYRPSQAVQVGVWAGGCAWLRPELAPFVLTLLCYFAFRRGRAATVSWAIAGLCGVALLVFRLELFGHLLPMSSAAKPSDLQHGLAYASSLLSRPENLSLSLVLVWMGVGQLRLTRAKPRLLTARRGLSSLQALLLALSAHLVAVVLAGGDWMPGFRLLAPVVPVSAWALGGMSARAMAHKPAFVVALGLLLALRAVALGPELVRAREVGALREKTRAFFEEATRDLQGPVVALDVGLLGAVYAGPIVDLGGLTEPRIAYTDGGHLDKRVESAWLEAQAPALILLHSAVPPRVDAQGRVRWFQGYPVERRVLAMPWVSEKYEVSRVEMHAPQYFYLLLTKRGQTPFSAP